MSIEIERKFLLGELPGRLAGRSGQRISQGYLSNADGAEIRLRRAGERSLLTVKTGAGEVREEVEVELDGELFDSLWPLTEGRRLLKTRLLESLGGGLSAEIDVYDGGLRGLVVAEVEFETPEASREFAPPSWLGEEVTGDPRYANRALAAGAGPPRPRRQRSDHGGSTAFELQHGEDVGDGIRRIARGRVAHALAALEDGSAGDQASAIHTARKDMKKIRAVLRLTRSELGEEIYRTENRRWRDAGRTLSGSRDAAVKVETLTKLEGHYGRSFPSASGERWKRLLETEREEAAAAAQSFDSGAIATAISVIEAGREEIETWALEGQSWKLLGPGLRRGYSRGRKAMKRVASEPESELVHEWRKRSKDLWYQLRLLRPAWPEGLAGAVDSSHELADLLGDHHDLTVLAADLGEREELGDRRLLGEQIERRQGQMLATALELGERLYTERPKAFERRLHAYWSAWTRGG